MDTTVLTERDVQSLNHKRLNKLNFIFDSSPRVDYSLKESMSTSMKSIASSTSGSSYNYRLVQGLNSVIQSGVIDGMFDKLTQLNTIESEGINVDAATSITISRARLTAETLAEVGVVPIRVTNNVEGGVTIVYQKSSDLIIYLEVYNDGDVGYIIENTKEKKIIGNEDILPEKTEQKVLSLLRD